MSSVEYDAQLDDSERGVTCGGRVIYEISTLGRCSTSSSMERGELHELLIPLAPLKPLEWLYVRQHHDRIPKTRSETLHGLNSAAGLQGK